MAGKAILYDATKCTGCRACQVACKQWNELEAETTTNRGSYENPPDLSPHTRVKIRFEEISNNENGAIDWIFTRQACMHCNDAACVEICPSGALSHHPLGFVDLDKDKCTGCGYCIEFCPFQIPRSQGSNITGMRKVDKCSFCADRVMSGYEPACVKTCPTGALQFGERDKMIDIGRGRIKEIKQACPHARLYGESELGGLHVIYVLPSSAEVHGLPERPQVPNAAAVHKFLQWTGVGAAAAVGAGLLLNLMVARIRMNEPKKEG